MGSYEQTLPKLPVIQFKSDNLKPGTSSWAVVCNNIRCALEEYGCFVAVYDKVSSDLDHAIFGALEELFELPTESKVQNISDKPYFGYVGQLPKVPLYESMGISDPQTLEGAKSFTNVMWPTGNEHFCEIIHSYAKLVSELEKMVKRMVFESYGVEKCNDSLNNGSTTYLLRASKYKGPQVDETKLGLASHTDKSFMTILHQNQVNGLEVKSRSGDWIGFDEQLPSSFVVMAGDAFLAWSNNRIHAPNHRVVMRGDKARYSLGLFSLNKGIIEIPEELVDEEHPQQFKPFHNFELFHFAYSSGKVIKSDCCAKDYCGV